MEKISTFAERLKEIMKENNISQSDLSRYTGINRTLINKYLRGENGASEIKLQQLSSFFSVNSLWLQGYDVSKGVIIDFQNDSNEKRIVKTRMDGEGGFEQSIISEKDLIKMFRNMSIDEFDDVMKYIALRTSKIVKK